MNQIIRNKKRRKSEQGRKSKSNLNFSQIRNNKLKYTITSTKMNYNENNNIITNNNLNDFFMSDKNQKNLPENPSDYKAISLKKMSYYNPMNNKVIIYNNFAPKRNQKKLTQTNIQSFLNKLKMNQLNRKKSYNYKNNYSSIERLNSIEKNIKDAINNMKIEIEKEDKDIKISSTLSPKLDKNKKTFSPTLKLHYLKKKSKRSTNKKLQLSFNEESNKKNNDFSFKKCFSNKRSKSFNFNETYKIKLFTKIKKKINYDLLNITYNEDDDESDKENDKGFSFHPNSNFIFIFDLLLILANIFSFILLPLSIANNKDIREKDYIIKEIINYSIDIIFLLDTILGFFRGYYNFEMNIIRNNKKICSNYLKTFFIIDLIESIPIYSINKIFLKYREDILYSKDN